MSTPRLIEEYAPGAPLTDSWVDSCLADLATLHPALARPDGPPSEEQVLLDCWAYLQTLILLAGSDNSAAIHRMVDIDKDATIEDIEDRIIDAWRATPISQRIFAMQRVVEMLLTETGPSDLFSEKISGAADQVLDGLVAIQFVPNLQHPESLRRALSGMEAPFG